MNMTRPFRQPRGNQHDSYRPDQYRENGNGHGANRWNPMNATPPVGSPSPSQHGLPPRPPPSRNNSLPNRPPPRQNGYGNSAGFQGSATYGQNEGFKTKRVNHGQYNEQPNGGYDGQNGASYGNGYQNGGGYGNQYGGYGNPNDMPVGYHTGPTYGNHNQNGGGYGQNGAGTGYQNGTGYGNQNGYPQGNQNDTAWGNQNQAFGANQPTAFQLPTTGATHGFPPTANYGLGSGFGFQGHSTPFAPPMFFPNGFPMPVPNMPFPPLFPPLPFAAPNNQPGTRTRNFSHQAHDTYLPSNMSSPALNTPSQKKDKNSKQPKISTPRPSIDPAYTQLASTPSTRLTTPQRLLIILDLNGTLIYRPDSRKNPKKMVQRPFLREFLTYLFDNFAVMVWSSARPINVQSLVDQVLPKDQRAKLVAAWARDTFGLSEQQFNQNVQVYKDLRRVWNSEIIQKHCEGYTEGQRFDQRNTLLIDDTCEKAWAQQFNLVEIPEFDGNDGKDGNKKNVLNQLAGYLQEARFESNVSAWLKERRFEEGKYWYEWPKMEGVVVPAAEEEGDWGRDGVSVMNVVWR